MSSKKGRILYISYDGMTDSLGQSQVLAYLKRLSKYGYIFDILSFEKPDNYEKSKDEILKSIEGRNINWIPLSYTKSPSVISTLKDLYVGWKHIKYLYSNNSYDIVHCRGYIAAILGLRCKKEFRSKFIFDMRGWWADEKKESGLWDNILFNPVYKYFKKLEKDFFRESNYSISLTNTGKREIIGKQLKNDNIAVIPTCVDFDVFKPFSEDIRLSVRQSLKIPSEANVLIYSGALGTNYNNEGIFKIYQTLRLKNKNSYFLILSKDNPDYVNAELKRFNVNTDNIRIVNSSYADVHKYLMAGDVGIILYKKQFSAIGRSPTKLGEYWASGLPMISVKGLGDLDDIIYKYPEGGNLIEDIGEEEISDALEIFFEKSLNKSTLRKYAEEYFSIQSGVEKYNAVYEKLLS